MLGFLSFNSPFQEHPIRKASCILLHTKPQKWKQKHHRRGLPSSPVPPAPPNTGSPSCPPCCQPKLITLATTWSSQIHPANNQYCCFPAASISTPCPAPTLVQHTSSRTSLPWCEEENRRKPSQTSYPTFREIITIVLLSRRTESSLWPLGSLPAKTLAGLEVLISKSHSAPPHLVLPAPNHKANFHFHLQHKNDSLPQSPWSWRSKAMFLYDP